MGSVLAAPFFVSAGLLAWGGATKMLRPQSATQALAAARLPASALAARVLGLAELTVGAAALLAPGRASGTGVATLYAGFAGFLGLALATRAPLSSCGCFGTHEVPPNRLHLSLTVLASAVGGLVAGLEPDMPGLVATAAGLPLLGVPFLLGLLAAGRLVSLATAYLPQLMRAYRPPAEA